MIKIIFHSLKTFCVKMHWYCILTKK